MPGPLVSAGSLLLSATQAPHAGGAPRHTCVERVCTTSDARGFIIARRPEMRKCLYTITRQYRLSEYSVLSHCIAWFIGRSRENVVTHWCSNTIARHDTLMRTPRRGAQPGARRGGHTRDGHGAASQSVGRATAPTFTAGAAEPGARGAPSRSDPMLRPSHRGRRHRSRSDLHAAGGGAAPHRRRPGRRGENLQNRQPRARSGRRGAQRRFHGVFGFVEGRGRPTRETCRRGSML